jgi:hypothetical protein
MIGTPNRSALLDFLASEFHQYGFDAASPVASSSIYDWSLARDEAGFTLTTSSEAHALLKAYLAQVFSMPKFDSAETLIYRNDDKHTTVMLSAGESTQLIVLHWQDPAVQSKIARARDDAIEEVFDRWQSEMEVLLTAADAASDEAERSAVLEEASRTLEELMAEEGVKHESSEARP